MRYRLAVAAAYVATLVWFAYSSERAIPDWIAIFVVFVAPFAVGFIVGRVWAALLPFAAVLLALPAGYGGGELPIWVAMMFVGLVATPEIVIGWGARWVADRYVSR